MRDPGPDGARPWLVIDHPDGARDHVRISLALTTIGRSEQNVIELLDPKLSRFHCEIERRAAGYTVRDCNSRNGTLVNGEPVSSPRLLADGDRVKLGRTLITFSVERPAALHSDAAVAVRPLLDRATPGPRQPVSASGTEQGGINGADEGTHAWGAGVRGDTPHLAQRRPGGPSYDARPTLAVESLRAHQEDPWRFVAEASLALLDATSRGALLEETVERARHFFQARGGLLALGRGPEQLTCSAFAELDDAERERCLEVAGRVLVSRGCILEERRAAGVPIRSRGDVHGALVLHDLAGSAAWGSKELLALQNLADIVGRALSGSMLLEEVRREERAAGARRIAHDLRAVLRPDVLRAQGLEAVAVTARADEVGRDAWDQVEGPERAGRREVYFAFGEVPDADAPPRPRLRRSGERGLVSLLGQAELRGALRSLVDVLPRTSDLLAQLDQALRRGGPDAWAVERMALGLIRFEPQEGTLRFATSGLPAALVRRRDGRVEALEGGAAPLGAGDAPAQVVEREVRWSPGDQLVLLTSAALPLGDSASRRDHVVRVLSELGDPNAPATEVAQRLLAELLAPLAEAPEGAALLLLRRS